MVYSTRAVLCNTHFPVWYRVESAVRGPHTLGVFPLVRLSAADR